MAFNFYNDSEEFLIKISDKIENLDKDSIFDIDYSDGILNIIIDETNQQYVINRHNANQKIWYSSPLTGADYFAYDENSQQWLNDDKKELEEKLFEEIKKFLDK